MKKIKHILLSCDENIVYTNFWPTVSYHYKQLGYNIIILPKKSVKDRVNFILETLH